MYKFEMNAWTEDNPFYNLVPDRLGQIICNWVRCMSPTRAGFGAYKKQDRLETAELGLEFLEESVEVVLNNTITELNQFR